MPSWSQGLFLASYPYSPCSDYSELCCFFSNASFLRSLPLPCHVFVMSFLQNVEWVDYICHSSLRSGISFWSRSILTRYIKLLIFSCSQLHQSWLYLIVYLIINCTFHKNMCFVLFYLHFLSYLFAWSLKF
jgi:hypothetical protein